MVRLSAASVARAAASIGLGPSAAPRQVRARHGIGDRGHDEEPALGCRLHGARPPRQVGEVGEERPHRVHRGLDRADEAVPARRPAERLVVAVAEAHGELAGGGVGGDVDQAEAGLGLARPAVAPAHDLDRDRGARGVDREHRRGRVRARGRRPGRPGARRRGGPPTRRNPPTRRPGGAGARARGRRGSCGRPGRVERGARGRVVVAGVVAQADRAQRDDQLADERVVEGRVGVRGRGRRDAARGRRRRAGVARRAAPGARPRAPRRPPPRRRGGSAPRRGRDAR